MENLDKFVDAVRAQYGTGMWTLQEVLGVLPADVFPAGTQFVRNGRGAMISLGHHVAKRTDVVVAGKTHGGRKLYRIKT